MTEKHETSHWDHYDSETSILLPFEPEDITQQYAATCKLNVLASLDRFFARKHHFQPIPVHKNTKGVYKQEQTTISLRQLAKELGSLQGELLEIGQVVTLLEKKLGYTSTVLTPDNESSFRDYVTAELRKGQPVIAFFATDLTEGSHWGLPISSQNESLEHACLITGYDVAQDHLRITHWGKHFWAPLRDFYESNRNLNSTRMPENYFSLKQYFQSFFNVKHIYAQQRKYQSMDKDSFDTFVKALTKMSNLDKNTVELYADLLPQKTSIIPEKDSGFKGKIICISPLSLTDEDAMKHHELRQHVTI